MTGRKCATPAERDMIRGACAANGTTDNTICSNIIERLLKANMPFRNTKVICDSCGHLVQIHIEKMGEGGPGSYLQFRYYDHRLDGSIITVNDPDAETP